MIKLNCCLNLEDYGLLLQDGRLTITKTIDEAIYIDGVSSITLKDNVSAKIVDEISGGNIEILVASNANLNYQILNSSNCNHNFACYGNLHVMQISLGQTNENFNIELLNENANADVELLSLGSNAKKNFIQSIVHSAKNTNSNISNFGIAMKGTDILFDTTGKIHKSMAKSVCKQLSKGVVMDNDSAVTSRPILLIDEYDVIANHGASIGKMSDESLFYLMSRGLTKTEAFLLILEGILRPFIDQILDDEIKSNLEKEIRALI